MSRAFREIRANIFYGAVVLIPFAALLLVAYYLYRFWVGVLTPVSQFLGLETLDSQLAAMGLAVAALLLICFVVGAVIRTRVGSWTFDRIEDSVLINIPGYGIISTLLRGFADDRHAYPAALVRLVPGGAQSLGFIMEDTGSALITVFVPSAPVMTVGQIYAVPRDDVVKLEGASIEAANTVSQWGVGLQASLEQAGQTAAKPGTSATNGQS